MSGRGMARTALNAVAASPLRVPIRALTQRKVIPRSVWRRLPATGAFTVKTHTSSFLYETPQDDRSSRMLYWGGVPAFEPETTVVWEHAAAKATTVVDIGANRGVYTLTALAASPTVRVVSIEASPATFAHMEQMVALNGWTDRVELVNAAAADVAGTMAFHVPKMPLAPSARLVVAAHRSELSGEVVDVPVVRLDDIVAEADIVKIDVEGAEPLVLAGMSRLLETSRPPVLIEVLPEADNDACTRLLEPYGYRFFRLEADGEHEQPGLIPDPARLDKNYVCRPG